MIQGYLRRYAGDVFYEVSGLEGLASLLRENGFNSCVMPSNLSSDPMDFMSLDGNRFSAYWSEQGSWLRNLTAEELDEVNVYLDPPGGVDEQFS